ncbi:TPA: hypothetical protein QFT81_002736 [Staphylococcus aureus]|nr:hypothetical protein [Staphylococcus aureus]
MSEAKPPDEDTTLKELIPEHVKTFLINAVTRIEMILGEIRSSRMGELTKELAGETMKVMKPHLAALREHISQRIQEYTATE